MSSRAMEIAGNLTREPNDSQPIARNKFLALATFMDVEMIKSTIINRERKKPREEQCEDGINFLVFKLLHEYYYQLIFS